MFVLEGKAPDIKLKTIAQRNNIRHGFRERKTNKKIARSQFNRILNECKEMLRYMGLNCIQAHGEAEAMCAYLNKDGVSFRILEKRKIINILKYKTSSYALNHKLYSLNTRVLVIVM